MDLQDLFPAAITFVSVGVLLAFGLSIQSTIRTTGGWYGISGCNSSNTSGCGYENNATSRAIEANNNISTNLPILGTILVAAVVIGVLIKSFVMK